MLGIGLPVAILLGALLATVLLDVLSFFEAAILGTMLAATDAALGKAVVTNEAVPAHLREGFNCESGLNDSLCVPFLLLFIAFAAGKEGGSPVLRRAGSPEAWLVRGGQEARSEDRIYMHARSAISRCLPITDVYHTAGTKWQVVEETGH